MTSFHAYYANVATSSPLVRQHLPSIEWLVSGRQEDRGTGRTTALALAFLRESFSNTGYSELRVFDHNLVQNDHDGNLSRQWIVQKLRGMGVMASHSGIMENQPYYAANRSSPSFNNTLRSTERDFRDLVAAAIRLGVSPEWMVDHIRNALADSVIST